MGEQDYVRKAEPQGEQQEGESKGVLTERQDLVGNAAVAAALPGTALAGTPATKVDAIARHHRNRQHVQEILAAMTAEHGGDAEGQLHSNSAEWLQAGLAKLQILTPTHDGHLRPKRGESEIAFYDSRADEQNGAPAQYDDSLNEKAEATKDGGVLFEPRTVRGRFVKRSDMIQLMDPLAGSEAALKSFIAHEVQHDADHHYEAPGELEVASEEKGPLKASQGYYNAYATEFRAYWQTTPEGSSDDRLGSSQDPPSGGLSYSVGRPVPGALDLVWSLEQVSMTVAASNERQRAIIEHMMGFGPWVELDGKGGFSKKGSYGYLPFYYAHDPEFRAFVDGTAKTTLVDVVSLAPRRPAGVASTLGVPGHTFGLAPW